MVLQGATITLLPSTEFPLTTLDHNMIECILYIFNRMLKDEMAGIHVEDITDAIVKIRQAYRLISMNPSVPVVNYNETKFRCAYIYINFVCHTSLIWNRMGNFKTFYEVDYLNMMSYDRQDLNICSLGGGPGCDIFGFLGARSEMGGLGKTRNFHCTVVDMYGEWKKSLDYGLSAFLENPVGSVYRGIIDVDLITCDLCQPLSSDVKGALVAADVVTLVRYVSVVSGYYDGHRDLLTSIFGCLKTGAYVLYIDNSIQRLYRMVSNAADAAGLTNICPRKYCKRYLPSRVISRMKWKLKTKPLRIATVFFCVWQKRG